MVIVFSNAKPASKYRFFLVIIFVFVSYFASAQNFADFTFAHFEDGTAEGFVDGVVMDNPDPDATNPSSKVMHYTGGAWWGPSKWESNGHFRPEHLKVIVDVYIPAGALQNFDWLDQPASIFILHARNCAQENVEHWQSENQMIYQEETWITIEFDLGSLEHLCYRNLILAGSSSVGFYSDNFRWQLTLPDPDPGVIFSENFEGAIFPPQGWTIYSAGSAERSWQRTYEKNRTPLGRYAARHESAGFEAAENWLISPPITLPPTGDFKVAFGSLNTSLDWYAPHAGRRNSVWVSSEGNDPTTGSFVKIWEEIAPSDSWTEAVAFLSGLSGEEIHIAFVYEGVSIAHTWFIDDITVYEGDPMVWVQMEPATDCAANYIDINISMENPVPIVAFQFDFRLPEGFGYVPGSVSIHRKTNHQARGAIIADSLLRVIGFSPNNESFTEESGLLVSFKVHAANEAGDFQLPFSRAIASDVDGNNLLMQVLHSTISLSPSTTQILLHPESQTADAGTNIEFVTEAEGENLSYQWFFNGQPLTGANHPLLILDNVNSGQEGEYFCRIYGDCGILDTHPAWLTVINTVVYYEAIFHVSDTQNQPVGNALVTVGTEHEISTDDQGQTQLELLPGTYPYRVMADGFEDFSGLFFITNNNVNLFVTLSPATIAETYPAEEIRVIPNPFNHFIDIKNNAWAKRFTITDLPGRNVLGGVLTDDTSQRIDTSAVQPGMYLLTLFGKQGQTKTIRIYKGRSL